MLYIDLHVYTTPLRLNIAACIVQCYGLAAARWRPVGEGHNLPDSWRWPPESAQNSPVSGPKTPARFWTALARDSGVPSKNLDREFFLC